MSAVSRAGRRSTQGVRTGLFRPDLRALLSSAPHVALLLIGEAFRSGLGRGDTRDLPCNRSSYGSQHEAAKSYVSKVIEPLEAHGARVDVLLTFPRCADVADGHRLLAALMRWYAPRVVARRVVRSLNLQDGWRHGHQLLRTHYGSRMPDFVLQSRHDLYMEAPLHTWPANFSRLNFERQCAYCDGGCSCNGRLARIVALRRPDCQLCHGDKLLWIPRRFLDTLSGVIIEQDGSAGHSLIHSLRSAGLQDSGQTTGYLFPEECAEFPIQLICNEMGAYRPAHASPDTGVLPPSPEDWAKSTLVTNFQKNRRRQGVPQVPFV